MEGLIFALAAWAGFELRFDPVMSRPMLDLAIRRVAPGLAGTQVTASEVLGAAGLEGLTTAEARRIVNAVL